MTLLGIVVAGYAAASTPPAPKSLAVGAVMEPEGVVEQYRDHARAQGAVGDAAKLLCKPAIEGLMVCASVISADGWRYATHADADVTRPTVQLTPEQFGLQVKHVEGIGTYWVRDLNDGKAGLVFVDPSLLPAGAVVAWPVPGVVIAWISGKPRLDQILSVGVAKMMEESTHPISSKLYRHADKGWVVWGEAKRPVSP